MNKLYEETHIQGIANAIRAKGVSGQMTVAQMPGKIASIPTGTYPSGTLTVTGAGMRNVYSYEYVEVREQWIAVTQSGSTVASDVGTSPATLLAILDSMGRLGDVLFQAGTAFILRD